MPRLQPCPECGRHIRTRVTTCPHCDATLSSPGLSPRGAALGLALASTVACSGAVDPGEPEYGVPYTPDTSDTSDTGEAGEEAGEEGGEAGGEGGEAGGEGGEEGSEGTSGESDYGLAALPELGPEPAKAD